MAKTITITSTVNAGSKNVSVFVEVVFDDGDGTKDYDILGPANTLFASVFPNNADTNRYCQMILFGQKLSLDADLDTININGLAVFANGVAILNKLAEIIVL